MHKSKEKIRFLFGGILFMLLFFAGMQSTVYAEEDLKDETGYQVVIEDDADLVASYEEALLAELMQEITVYGNVAFKTIDENDSSTESFIKNYYKSKFGSESGTVFLIDMDNRNIWIHSNGAIYRVITKSYANTITDNVYTYASDAEYFICAYEAFDQILTLLQGNKIAQPMKYISNAFLALILSLIITYFLVRLMSKSVKPSEKQLLEATRNGFKFENVEIVHTNTTKRYDPPSSGGGGGGSRGGGGGGGGHSF